MSRRSLLLAICIGLLLAVGSAAALFAAVRHEPAVFVRAPMPDEPEARHRLSGECLERILALYNAINGDREWDEEFTDEQINSYLGGEFIRQGIDRQLLPDGISEPRVVFGADSIHLAFRYGTGTWSTIISIDLRVWVPRCEPNVVALELQGFHAGALPISTQSLLERIGEVGRMTAVDIAWYRHNGHPVALLRFGTDSPRTTMFLDTLRLQPGSLAVKVRTAEPTSAHVMLPRADTGLTNADN